MAAAGPYQISVPGNPGNPVFYSNYTVLEDILVGHPRGSCCQDRAETSPANAAQGIARSSAMRE